MNKGKTKMNEKEKALCRQIGEQILQVLNRKGLYQNSLSKGMDKSDSYLSRRFNLDVPWSVIDLYNIASELEVNITELLPLNFKNSIQNSMQRSDSDIPLAKALSTIIPALQELSENCQTVNFR